VRQQDLVGLTGEVLLDCDRDQRGLVRLRVRDCWIDARAYGSDERPLLRGDRALVLHQDTTQVHMVYQPVVVLVYTVLDQTV
jgi:hypothetical protein